jgi:phosphatidylserine synthase
MATQRMFGIKDLFTTINLMGGVVAMCLCVDGKPFEAGLSVMIGYFCGDTLDGYVARKLGTQNEFGAEFDTIADHLSHVVAPAVIVYTVYKDLGLLPPPWGKLLAIFLAGSLIFGVSVRHARNIVKPVSFKGVWVGLPRSVLGFLAIAYCNATLAPHVLGGWWLGVFLMPFMAYATLTYWPFPSHHLARGMRPAAKIAMWTAFASSVAIAFLKREFFFDLLFFWMAGYCMSAWMSLNPQEREAYRETVRAARAGVVKS